MDAHVGDNKHVSGHSAFFYMAFFYSVLVVLELFEQDEL